MDAFFRCRKQPSRFIFKGHPIFNCQTNKHYDHSSMIVVRTTRSAVGGGSNITVGCGGGRCTLIDTGRLRLLR